ncbi:type II toxin-antitoxin system VapC family toxin [Thermodesulfobacterium sp. TA1]|uniref:PIN domain-containing protein n=1 Tax=Thermodesulfobacterium sp. TA1 TaxID=2234087 RepID=UPI00123223B5|nr:PIN domain-containing protein [Thermodesulfobacterium sp. TA1]QER41293.1 type II toxin-antitoxin system VapC family toxin [Thermodesulfobacterium sp. TA1]
MRKFLDTNIFPRYLTKDDEEKAYKVLDLLKKIEKGEEKVITSPLVIFELIFTLQKYYKLPKEEIKNLVLPLINLRGLKLPYKAVFEKTLEVFPNTNVSFADLFNYFFMLEHEVKEIYSYDEDFDELPEVKRLVP